MPKITQLARGRVKARTLALEHAVNQLHQTASNRCEYGGVPEIRMPGMLHWGHYAKLGNGDLTEMFKQWHPYEPIVTWKVVSTRSEVRRLSKEMTFQTKRRLQLKDVSEVEATDFSND